MLVLPLNSDYRCNLVTSTHLSSILVKPNMSTPSHLRLVTTHNLRTLRRQPLAEVSGSLGDLGTLLPLLVALTLTSSISLSSTLVFTGLANILTGLLFGIPLPVQPMKAIAAVAISRRFTQEETAAAGLFVGAVVGVLSASGLLRWVASVVPVPVVKGIQVGAGLSLVLSAGGTLLGPLDWVKPSWADNLLWALAAFLLLLATTDVPRVPYALLVVGLGSVLAAVQLSRVSTCPPGFQLWRPSFVLPGADTFLRSALTAGVGQLPLTTLNSVIAVVHLSSDLMPSVPAPSVTQMGVSVAIMNLIGCWFGAMPACHGSGGLAGQYRFGARSGSSVVILGSVKLIMGLFVGDGLVGVLAKFPKSLLGVMVVAAGVELAKVGESLNVGARDLWEQVDRCQADGEEDEVLEGMVKRPREPSERERRDRWSVMLVTVAGLLAFRNDAVGFIAGMLWHWRLKLPRYGWLQRRRGAQRADGNDWLSFRHGESERSSAGDEEAEGLLATNYEAPEGRPV